LAPIKSGSGRCCLRVIPEHQKTTRV
jgi:hypothetical protein